ncbi:MAG: OsmC family protein [Candidatus Cloacimonetes bacterium]|nr:OsmC family protein [Candidatus Cloacimonadota bacterium]
MDTKLTWKGDFKFESQIGDHTLVIDSNKPGQPGIGPSPKRLLLTALGGCTGMDVVYILKNYGFEDFEFELEIDAGQTDKHPKIYKDITIKYIFKGKDLSTYKLKRAVELSTTQYCGVSAMLKASADITYEIYLNGEKIE